MADDIINEAPIFCKGVRNGRELTKKKKIKTEQFIYARLDDEKWIKTDGISVKYDKVLIEKSYLNKIPELSDDNIKEPIEKAPEIIELSDNEKFTDAQGNIFP